MAKKATAKRKAASVSKTPVKKICSEIKQLEGEIMSMAEVVEEAVDSAVLALADRNTEIARNVIRDDYAINQMELSIDRICHEILEKAAPKGKDLRYVTACLKIINDLERMGDLAANISKYAIILSKKRAGISTKIDYSPIFEQTSKMARDSIKALFDRDTAFAEQIIIDDDIVDRMCDGIITTVTGEMEKDPKKVSAGIYMIQSAIALERIADLATNIVEELVYIEKGTVIRHRLSEDDGMSRDN